MTRAPTIENQDEQQCQYHELATQLATDTLPEGWCLVGSSAYARVIAQPEQNIYYKEFLPRSPLEFMKALVKGSRATRARKQNDALRATGFAAPRNLAWGQLPGGREYLFSSAMPGRGVTQWLRDELAGPGDDNRRRRWSLLRGLGRFVGRLHAAGFVHGDLRTSNVLAEWRDGAFHFSLIDNERNTRQQPAAGRDILRNLMQLDMLTPADISNTDRMRCFRQWRLQMPQLNDAEAKLLAREAHRWSTRRLRAKGKLQDGR